MIWNLANFNMNENFDIDGLGHKKAKESELD